LTKSHFARDVAKPQVANIKVSGLILKRFFVFFLLLAVIFFGISLPVYLQYKNNLEEQLLAKEEISVASAVQMFQKELYEQLHMIDLIVQSHTLKEYLAEGTVEQRVRVEQLFETIATSFYRFDQIRLLDNSGLEQIRVNLVDGQGQTTAKENLQSKAQRYYFQAASGMPLGQIYISAMDLNVEQGALEIPHKPTLRFATPLTDGQGNRAGVLVINYLAQGMLVRFRQLMSQRADQQGMLLDNQGYWLSNHERENEWGADLGRPDRGFAQFYPDAWPVVAANKSGVLETKEGIFRYQSVEPLNFSDSRPAHFRIERQPSISKESYANTEWKLVIFLPRYVIDSHSFLKQPLGRTLLALFILMIAGLAFLGAYLAVHRQLRLQKEQQERILLEQQASIDALTGIRNRRSFYELGEVELKRALRHKVPLAALMVDADYFKKINDNYGHAVGDLVLKDLAATMSETLREVDLLGRVGGEEFVVLLLHTSLPQALEVAERLRLNIAERKVSLPEGASINFTVSIGLAMLTDQEKQLTDLFKKADLALYEAKKLGRNRVVSYRQDMSC